MHGDDLTRLRSLVAVVDAGSIAAAALVTGYSTAAISRHIAALERELGLVLFERTARSLRPSVLARVVADKARLLLDEAQSFSDDVRSLARGDSGVIRLAYFRAVGTTLLPFILAELAISRPEARVVTIECMVSEEVVGMLRTGQADLGFIWGFLGHDAPDLRTVPLLDDALVLMTSADRDDLHAEPGNLERLVHEPFVSAVSYATGSPPIVDRMFVERGLPAPTVRHRHSDHAMTKALVATGAAVSLLPALGVSDSAPGTRRSIVSARFRRIYLARPSGTTLPLVAALEATIREVSQAYRGYGVVPSE